MKQIIKFIRDLFNKRKHQYNSSINVVNESHRLKIDDVVKTGVFDESQIKKFENIWIHEYKYHHLGVSKDLSDDDYIDYHIWKDINWRHMYDKHMPNARVLRGDNPNLIFHGGCLGCLSQRKYGVDRCKGCSYFRFKGSENLFIEGENSAKMDQKGLDDFLNGK